MFPSLISRDHDQNPLAHQPPAKSLYASECAPAMPYPPLMERERTDIAIIGAGITGLSTALAVAERGGSCTVLESNEPGWGASGRNGGHVNPGFKLDPDEIERRFGKERANRIIDFGYRAADRVFETVRKHRIDCDAVRGGGYRAAINLRSARRIRHLVDQCSARGMPVEYHDSKSIEEATGTTRYIAAMLDKRAGQLNPLKYVRGLAAAAAASGIRLHCNSPVIAIERDGAKWRLKTPQGQMIADQVLFATNGYTGPLIRGLSRSILPVFSSIISTVPLPEALARRILPNRQVLFEAGRVTTYYRVDSNQRLIFGGRGLMRDAAGPASFPDLAAYARKLWPDINEALWEFGWNGRIAVTTDHFPHVYDLEDGRLICLGYNGRGIALATAMGDELASMLLGQNRTQALPIVPLRRIRLQPWWKVGAHPVIAWSRLADRLGL